ncbi:MAG: polysaccharide biosynthesis protein [Lachnospiraceae bacterium]|nr:polysaccharide biosynthesis protein [Lachnospiraceae bacterium]
MGNTKKKSENNFIVQGGILVIAGFISRFIGMIYRIPMTNALGDKGLAYYENAYVIYNLALIISSYGLPMAVSRMVAAKNAKKEYKNAYKLFKASLIFATISGGVMALFIFIFAKYLSIHIYKTPYCMIPLKILAPTIFLCAIMGVIRGYFQGNGNMVPTAVSQLIEQIINAIVSVVATLTFMKYAKKESFYAICDSKESWGAGGGTLGTFIGAIFGLLTLIIIFMLNRRKINYSLKSDTTNNESNKAIYKIMLLTILPIILAQTLYNLNSIVDRSLFSHLSSYSKDIREDYLGRFGKYYLLVNIPIAVATALGNSVLPVIVKE